MMIRFPQFISQTISFETGGDKSGAYHHDPDDAGGETKWGVSKRAHPHLDIKNLTYKEAETLYHDKYYHKLYDEVIDPDLAFKIFDMGVLCGRKTAVKLAQEAIEDTTLTMLRKDGLMGPMTLTAMNLAIARGYGDNLYDRYLELHERRFRKLAFWKPRNKKFLNGWLNRLAWKKDRWVFEVPEPDKTKTKEEVKTNADKKGNKSNSKSAGNTASKVKARKPRNASASKSKDKTGN